MALATPASVPPRWGSAWWRAQASCRRSGGSHPGARHHGLLAGLARGGSGRSGLPGHRVPGPRADVVGRGWYGGNFPLGYSVLFPPLARRLRPAGHGRGLRRHRHLGVRPGGPLVPRGPAHRNLVLRPVHPPPGHDRPVAVPGRRGGRAHGAGRLQRGRRPLGDRSRGLAALFSPLAAAFLAMVCLAWAAYGVGPAVLADRHGRGEPGDRSWRPGSCSPAPARSPSPGPAWSSPSCCA